MDSRGSLAARLATRAVAALALCVLLLGALAHTHAVQADAPEAECTACVLHHSTADIPPAPTPVVAAPVTELLPVPTILEPPAAVRPLRFAPKTSPPCLPA